ncbi:MAG TPA: hypothetical protein VJA22_03265 [Patescibacteria group bacterium]|nr:hypothetical protein [Patescibacteria group bacterium]
MENENDSRKKREQKPPAEVFVRKGALVEPFTPPSAESTNVLDFSKTESRVFTPQEKTLMDLYEMSTKHPKLGWHQEFDISSGRTVRKSPAFWDLLITHLGYTDAFFDFEDELKRYNSKLKSKDKATDKKIELDADLYDAVMCGIYEIDYQGLLARIRAFLETKAKDRDRVYHYYLYSLKRMHVRYTQGKKPKAYLSRESRSVLTLLPRTLGWFCQEVEGSDEAYAKQLAPAMLELGRLFTTRNHNYRIQTKREFSDFMTGWVDFLPHELFVEEYNLTLMKLPENPEHQVRDKKKEKKS